jgi:hypothetical protein
MIIENEEHLGTNQIVPMNIHNAVKVKKKKKRENQHLARERKRNLYDVVRKILGEPKLPNQKVQEFLKKPPDISTNPTEAEVQLFYLLKEKDQRGLSKKSPNKPLKSKEKCKGLSELFYEELVLEKKGVSRRRSLGEDLKKFSINITMGSLWSLKKVLCALIMIQGLVNRRRDLNTIGDLPLKLMNGTEEEITTGTISFFPARGS